MTNLLAGAWGAIAWLRRRPSVAFWYLLRVAQVAVVAPGAARRDPAAARPRGARRAPLRLRACCRCWSPCSPRRPAPGPPSASSTGSTSTSLPARSPAPARARDRPPRDRDHGRLGAGRLLPRAARRRHQRRPVLDPAARSAPERPVRAAVEDQRLAAVGARASSTSPTAITWSPPSCRSRSSQATQATAPSRIGHAVALGASRPRRHFSVVRGLGREAARELLLVGGEHVDPEAARLARSPPACASRGRGRRASAAARARARRPRWRSPRRAVRADGRDHRHRRSAAPPSRARNSVGRWPRLGHEVGKYDAAVVRALCSLLDSRGSSAGARAAGAPAAPRASRSPRTIPNYAGAVLFAERCSGCHTLDGRRRRRAPANRELRNQGPNLDERVESVEDVLYAIRNGGFSGAIMPQNIVVGDEAEAVADFVAEYAGSEVERPAARRRERAESDEQAAAEARVVAAACSTCGRSATTRARPGRRSRAAAPPSALDELLDARRAPARAAARGRGPPRAPEPGLGRDRRAQARRRGRRRGDRARCETVSAELKQLRPSSPRSRQRRDELAATLPNLPDPEAPEGGPRTTPSPCARSASARSFDFEVRDHLELGIEHGWIEIEKAAAASGSRFAYLLGDLVMVELALVRFARRDCSRRGLRAGRAAGAGPRGGRSTAPGFFPGEREMIYEVERDELFLVGTSEVSLAALHADEILDAGELPRRYAGISTCFRREAGAAGKDTRGIFRVHQFDKVEMFSFVEPERIERRARAHPRDRGADPRRARDPLPGRRHRGRRPRRAGGAQVRLRGLDPEPGALPRAHLVLEHDRLPGAPPRRPLPARGRGAAASSLHTLNGTAVAVGRTLIALHRERPAAPTARSRCRRRWSRPERRPRSPPSGSSSGRARASSC